jgi:hypothetical protein
MNEIINLNQIDAAVHFEFLRRLNRKSPQTDEARQRLQRCDQRVAKLAVEPKALMLFFSTYVTRDEAGSLVIADGSVNLVALEEHMARINRYHDLLGPRFLLFDGLEKPTDYELEQIFRNRGFYADPNRTALTAYGEWQNVCVDGWFRHIKSVLNLSDENCNIDPNLSLPSPDRLVTVPGSHRRYHLFT